MYFGVEERKIVFLIANVIVGRSYMVVAATKIAHNGGGLLSISAAVDVRWFCFLCFGRFCVDRPRLILSLLKKMKKSRELEEWGLA